MSRGAVAVVAAAMLSGCGYALVGRGTAADPSVKRIGVPLFRDATGKAGLAQKITHQMADHSGG